jgi:hypothetical protein
MQIVKTYLRCGSALPVPSRTTQERKSFAKLVSDLFIDIPRDVLGFPLSTRSLYREIGHIVHVVLDRIRGR